MSSPSPVVAPLEQGINGVDGLSLYPALQKIRPTH